MCRKLKGCGRKIDSCMKNHLAYVQCSLKSNFKTVACCCGHKKYPKTIVVKHLISGICFDIMSGIEIPRKKKFYKKDEEGYYYIPEVIKNRD